MTSAVRRRRALDLGLSPRLSRQASDLRLNHNENRGWGVGSRSHVFTKTKSEQLLPVLSSQSNVITGDTRQRGGGSADPIPTRAILDAQRLRSARDAGDGTEQKLRRPTAFPVPPVLESGPLFHLLVKGKELKPMGIAEDEEACSQFYASHFPLLMNKLSAASDPEPAKRVITEIEVEEELRRTERNYRAKVIRERMARADDKLRQFETDPEDSGPITTELRTDLFNPAVWPWNVERYSLS